MRRRDMLRGVGVAGTVGVAGCLGLKATQKGDPSTPAEQDDTREEVAVEGTAPTLSPGTDATISARAYNVDRLQFRIPGPQPYQAQATEFEVSPSPDAGADSFPPIWFWDSPQPAVDASMVVSVPGNADAGKYTYAVEARKDSTQVTATFTATIQTETS